MPKITEKITFHTAYGNQVRLHDHFYDEEENQTRLSGYMPIRSHREAFLQLAAAQLSDRLNKDKGKDVKFREITAETDLVLTKPAKSNAVLFADFNNDALNDLLIVSRNAVACLYLNQGNGRMKDESHLLPVRLDMANGAVAADFDMDGYLDIIS